MHRIDCHLHYVPPSVGQQLSADIAAQSDFMRIVYGRPGWHDLDVLRKILDGSEIDMGLIIPSASTLPRAGSGPEIYEAYNQALSRDISTGERRFLGAAIVDPFGGKDSITQLERSLRLPNMAAIGLITNYGNISLDDPRFEPIFGVARDYDVPVTVHPGQPWPSWREPLRMGLSEFMWGDLGFLLTDAMCMILMAHASVFERFPSVRFMFCQLGGVSALCCRRWKTGIKYAEMVLQPGEELPAWARTTLNDILSHVWLDSHTQDRHAMTLIMAEAGDHTIVLGGDYPVTLPEDGIDFAIAELEALNLPSEVVDKIERRNALALLGRGAGVSMSLT